METALRANQTLQIQSFWNLIQSADEFVQRGILQLLHTKYASSKEQEQIRRSRFFSLKGALKSKGDEKTDKRLLEEYLEKKYGR